MRYPLALRPVALVNSSGLVIAITPRPLPVAQAESSR